MVQIIILNALNFAMIPLGSSLSLFLGCLIYLMPFFFPLQPILVYMSKVDGRFKFSPISVNFLTEVTKVIFAITMLIIQVHLKFP